MILILLIVHFACLAAGEIVQITQFPFLVAVNFQSGTLCSGVAISENFVITSYSDCLQNLPFEDVYVRSNLSVAYGDEDDLGIPIAAIYPHPDYDSFFKVSNVVILRLQEAIKFGVGAQPVALPDSSFDLAEGTTLLTLGYSYNENFTGIGSQLQSFEESLMLNSECQSIFANPELITNDMLCVRCRSDCIYGRGNILVTIDGVLFGILSRTPIGANLAIFTRIPAIRNFIADITGL